MSDEELKQLLPITAQTFLHAVEKVYETAQPRKHEAPDPNKPVCIHCGLADIAGDWDIYPCNDEWRKVIATQP